MTERVPARGNILGSVVPARYVLAILGSIAMAIVYGLKVNLSTGIVAMTNRTYLYEITENKTGINKPDPSKDGPFKWDSTLQGFILSSYFLGYLVSQIPGAHVAEKLSAKYVMLFSVAINVVCTILTPIAAIAHWSVFILMRIGEGIGGGVTFPAMHVLLASWAPKTERSTMSALVYAGTSLGTVLSMLLTPILAGFSWESIFYVQGGASCLWIFLWVWLAQDSPSKQPLISQEERDYINSSLGVSDKPEHAEVKAPMPWRRVLTSPPFLAILVAHTCSNWGWYTLLLETPAYLTDVFQYDVKTLAVPTSVPFLTLWLFSMGLSKTLDALRARGVISTTFARKTGTLIASVIPAGSLLILCYVTDDTVAVLAMALGITSIGGMFCGFLSNHIDIAPNYAGTLMALTNTLATFPGIIMPVFVGMVKKDRAPIEAWRIVFFVTIVLYVIEIVAYTLFGSGEEQPWNKSQARELVTIPSGNTGKSETTPLKGRENQPE